MPTAEQIQARLKAKYPKANLSKTRLDGISAKLLTKLPEDADEAAIDALLETVNDSSVQSFEEIAREDDRIRSIEAKQSKQQTGGDTSQSSQTTTATTTSAPDEMPAWFKPFAEEVNNLKQKQQGLTQAQQLEAFRQAAKEEKIPAFMLKTVQITPDFDQATALAALKEEWKEAQVEVFNNSSTYQPDNPQGSANKKEATKEELDAVMNKIM